MKIPLSIRRTYDEQEERYNRLKVLVDKKIKSFRDSRWHYESRVKEINSFCLKIESGRVRDPKNLEDFFACTIVVVNATEIEKAKNLVGKEFNIISTRPRSANFTHKNPDSFPFDDLRIYAKLKQDTALRPTGLEDILFEIQIKTFLQHAWAISTYDLVYKTDDVNWSKQRIAYQIKAMLEHAELSIYEVESISQSKVISKMNPRTHDVRAIISLIKRQWDISDLPKDLRRLSENILGLIGPIKISITDLEIILETERTNNNGVLTLNLSPYGVIVQALLKQKKHKMIEYLITKIKDKQKPLVLIPLEIEIPHEIAKEDCVNAIFVD